jgi:ribosomal protein S18 acetylase RimI-like enzyme
MTQVAIAIRTARGEDAPAIAAVHEAAWRETYRGIIPGRELERMISRRGPAWWREAVDRGARILLIDVADTIAGYASCGRSRVATLPHEGEIFELYLRPEYLGLGFGSRLFRAARKDLAGRGYVGLVVWSLAGNERACAFYEQMGGARVSRTSEMFGPDRRERIAYGWW